MTFAVYTLDALEDFPFEPGFADCCVTSPPYFGLRDYGVEGQVGLEPTPHEYVEKMVAVMREVWRVLKPEGTLWLNIGDSYVCAPKGNPGARGNINGGKRDNAVADKGAAIDKSKIGLQSGNLLGIPWRVALALQESGWILRSEIIWHKPNPLPESVRNRPTKAHEHVFLLTKQAKYYYDQEPTRTPYAESTLKQTSYGGEGQKDYEGAGVQDPSKAKRSIIESLKRNGGANARTVWKIPTQPFRGAHFAVMPEELARRCVLSGCPPGGTVLDPFCGAGTTGVVAVRSGRNFVGLELNPEFAEMARKRIEEVGS